MPRKRSANKRNRAVAQTPKNATNRALVPKTPSTQAVIRKPRAGGRRNILPSPLSEAGRGFLKCAFAPADFNIDPGSGIPDMFEGRTNVLKTAATTSLTFTPGKDTYIVVLPIPGLQYAMCEVEIGGEPDHFKGVHYPNQNTIWGNGTDLNTKQVTRFRYASQCVGLYPTSNYQQFSGSVTVWKPDVKFGQLHRDFITDVTLEGQNIKTSKTRGITPVINGLESITPLAPRDSFSTSFINGCYAVATQQDSAFPWSSIVTANAYVNRANTPTKTIESVGDGNYLNGLGTLETIVIKVTTPTGGVNSALLKTWTCVEAIPNSNAVMYQFAHLSPNCDPAAMMAYHKLKSMLPVAVQCADNADMWKRISSVLSVIFKGASYIPGPVGTIGSGLSTVLTGIDSLFL